MRCRWSGIVAPATAELEQDVREFFLSRKIDLGGTTLEQYVEQLRIAVIFRERERRYLNGPLKRWHGKARVRRQRVSRGFELENFTLYF